MIYKTFHELALSHLGMGNMRLPTVGERGPIDEPKARAIIEYLYEQGVNYFDTAYMYHGGESEKFVGKVLSQYPRESWYLADKMPGFMMKPDELPADIFEEQLARCGVDYIDFYLLHSLNDSSVAIYMDEQRGMLDYLLEQKEAGRIHYLGFSAHASPGTIQRFLDWRDCFDFAQIQLNYLDWSLQDAKRQYEILVEHEIPVMVMEPCRGGRLASLGAEANALLKSARPDDSIASWAFRFAKSLPGVWVVLSGMTQMDQAVDNVKTFSDPTPLSAEENGLLQQVVATLVDLVPCTACRYCMQVCPQQLDIPKLISMYNQAKFEHSSFTVAFTLSALQETELPSACVACGACSVVCPQRIDVPNVMEQLTELIERMPRR